MMPVNMWDACEALSITEEQRETLRAWIAARKSPQKVVFRSRIVMLAASGVSNNRIAQELKTSRPTVILWRNRFLEGGPTALTEDAPGRGRPVQLTTAKVKKIVEATLHTTPKAATHWSVRTMANAHGVSPATVQRIWDANGLQPHRTRTFKLSKDKQFVEKLNDVVGLYLNPPNKALVLCVDEKSQIQALERSQPGLPLKKGRCGTITHDYKRHGTTTLFAALNVLDGTVIGECMPRHRHQEYLKFLRKLDRELPNSLQLHLVVDNYSAHKHDHVTAWLTKHPRFHIHYTPTSSSWLNLVERWFRELTQKRLRRGNFTGVKELITTIEEYLAQNNKQPKPFVWTATAQQIIDKVNRCKGISETLH